MCASKDMPNKSIKAHQTPSVTNFGLYRIFLATLPHVSEHFDVVSVPNHKQITEQLNTRELTLLMCLILVLRTGSSIKDE